MRIGIDIDDTMTNIKDKLTNSAIQYAKSLNKDVQNIDYNIVDIYNNGNIYQKLFMGQKQFEKTYGITKKELLERYDYNKYKEEVEKK